MGIVTMEDLIEKIVGSIQDEYDSDELPDIAPLGEHTFLIQGTTDLEAVQDHFGTPLPISEYDTLSGFLIGQLGHIPSEDEKPVLKLNGLVFKAESVKDKRIETVKVTKSADKPTDGLA
jgi:putative hemolysin